jgi:hypothetical protein
MYLAITPALVGNCASIRPCMVVSHKLILRFEVLGEELLGDIVDNFCRNKYWDAP